MQRSSSFRTPLRERESQNNAIRSEQNDKSLIKSDSQMIKSKELINSFHWTVKASYLKLFVSFILLILILGLGSFSYSNMKMDQVNFAPLRENWTQNFINDIYVKPVNEKCDNGDEQLINYVWPGTEEGCECERTNEIKKEKCCPQATLDLVDFNKKTKILHRHNRESGEILDHLAQTDQSCCRGKNLYPLKAKDMVLWGFEELTSNQNNFSFQLCIKRSKNLNLKSIVAQNEKFCSDSEKMCEDHALEEKSPVHARLKFCINRDASCPLNNIHLSQNQTGRQEIEQIFQQNKPLGGQGINAQAKLYVSRQMTNFPLLNFRTTEGAGICRDGQQFGQSNQGKRSRLQQRDITQCEIDNRFEQLNSLSEPKFFNINEKSDISIREQLPDFVLDKNQKIKIFSQRLIKITFTDNCIMLTNEFFTQDHVFGKVESFAENTFLALVIILFILFSVFLQLDLDLLNQFKLNIHKGFSPIDTPFLLPTYFNTQNLEKDLNHSYINMIQIIKIFCILFYLITFGVLWVKARSINRVVIGFLNEGCTNLHSERWFKDFKEFFPYTSLSWVFGLSLILFIIDQHLVNLLCFKQYFGIAHIEESQPNQIKRVENIQKSGFVDLSQDKDDKIHSSLEPPLYPVGFY